MQDRTSSFTFSTCCIDICASTVTGSKHPPRLASLAAAYQDATSWPQSSLQTEQCNASLGFDSGLLLVGLLYLLWCGVSANAENPGSQGREKPTEEARGC